MLKVLNPTNDTTMNRSRTSRLLVLLSTLTLLSCIANTDGQFNNNSPTLDLENAVKVLFQQQKYNCSYSWIASGKEKRLKDLQIISSDLKSLLFHTPLSHNDKTYLISKYPYQSSDEAMKYCSAFGGYLAEVDDRNVQFLSGRPTLDLDFVNGALLEQHKELCDYEWIASGQEEKLKALDKVKDSLTPLLFQPPLMYGNSSYVISTFSHKDSIEAMKYCRAFGGYLAEVDDYNEFNEIQKWFMRSSVYEMLLIAGSDELKEGTWTFQRTGVALPFKSWGPKEPNNFQKSEHCLSLWRVYQGKMNDATCSFRDVKTRFMCELPSST